MVRARRRTSAHQAPAAAAAAAAAATDWSRKKPSRETAPKPPPLAALPATPVGGDASNGSARKRPRVNGTVVVVDGRDGGPSAREQAAAPPAQSLELALAHQRRSTRLIPVDPSLHTGGGTILGQLGALGRGARAAAGRRE